MEIITSHKRRMDNLTEIFNRLTSNSWMTAALNSTLVTSTLESVYFFPPIYYFLMFIQRYMEFMMDRMVLALVAFLMGMTVMFLAESLALYYIYKRSSVLPPPTCERPRAVLPEVLKSRITQPNLKQKEDCIWLNFFFQFLFHELKDSLNVRRLITKKIQVEFEELLKSKSGVFMDELFLRDFHLGDKFPVIMAMTVENVDVQDDIIRTLDLKAHLVYDGGLKIAIDAALPLATTAYISIKVIKIRGVARLQFTNVPYTHWSVSFYEEPEIELEVTAQLDGRSMPKLKNIIANQIKRIVRKKHTLPMYKMRFKPFFPPSIDLAKESVQRLQLHGTDIGCGILEVTVVECTRLSFLARNSRLYCVLSVDKKPWKQILSEKRISQKLLTIELIKSGHDNAVGMLVKDEIWEDRLLPVVIVDEVSVGTPAHIAGVKEGDILIGANDIKITSAKQASKVLKWGKDNRLRLQIDRDKYENPLEFLGLNRRASSWHSQHLVSKETEKKGTEDLMARLSVTAVKEDKTDSNVRHTVYKEGSENPKWNQKFIFSIDSNHNYLNVCVWCKGGDRSDKPELFKWSNHDVLIGYISLNLDDICLHCVMTLNGSLRDRFSLRHGHYKTEEELVKLWSVHKGWDPNQMYGDIHLDFCFHPYFLTTQQRRSLASCRAEAVKLQDELFMRTAGGAHYYDTTIKKGHKKNAKEGHHQFDSTNFTTATFCDFCGKKIWMKEAFKCKICQMVCHRKCLAKCLINTICTEQGAQKKLSTDHFEPWVPLNDPGKIKPAEDLRESYVSEEFSSRDDSVSELSSETRQLFEALYNAESPNDIMDLINTPIPPTSRFKSLQDQTERMKDSVMKHLKRSTKASNSLNDKAIMLAKEAGIKLFADMDVLLRRDKLNELITNLDGQMKLEMQTKDLLEKELILIEAAEKKSSSPKIQSEIKSLQHKVVKSSEKLDGMSLLMLQYCSALQLCLNTLEKEENESMQIASASKNIESLGSSKAPVSPKIASKSTRSAVTGFVKRAGTTMKEKVTSIKRDFGRKGKSDKDSPSQSSNNNTGLLTVSENVDLVLVVSGSDKIDLIPASEILEKAQASVTSHVNIIDDVEMIEVYTDINKKDAEKVDTQDTADSNMKISETQDKLKVKKCVKTKNYLNRSNSDSELEVNKTLSYSPEESLLYRGNSLPKMCVNDDSDSDSDFLVIDSTDDDAEVSDSSDNEDVSIPSNHLKHSYGLAIKKKYGAFKEYSNDDSETQHHSTNQPSTFLI
ncbi:PDZ domain-containing protein 8-like [Biomphalaria glabrata]|uniref:PDZ domain-containing protein 8-like n=1 Tax=Biomphalaria glabrata TaxID=6526 RepID=A0A9W3B7Z5_BIOGL|nr:PDZ domain-containing protein 8-like [Biomphalaria glabrata]XP_055895571.1 PDZ domain-containing protein 8-like [Biomphalaria glabrata]XP_055895573.1 PDZ domain-containing protein 8-like [Biomphalaria glabrata]XP_055895574.1 PDZ domain-containing protein 8-like [Biomphalaria glabrata]XP_055895575.1 PDZ domain-containing protein 8-like [Biomphalaria glabrata]XP_055895576.1 PDZ domain-containing protein 8-like [Biomphalaria glabrata]XP_055895577.1 PDZ domain-containing protein 8-like [Biomph